MNPADQIVALANAYKDAWLKLQDGAESYDEKMADIANSHAARLRLFDALGGRKVTLNSNLTDPNGWWCSNCQQQHPWGVASCPSVRPALGR